MQQEHHSQEIFTASDVGEYEYCPLVWWHQQYEPLSHAHTDELFARLVELEHEYGLQATSLPEYQVAEQLLVRRGAFEEGRRQHNAHAAEVADMEEERINIVSTSTSTRRFIIIAVVLLVIALLLIVVSLLPLGR